MCQHSDKQIFSGNCSSVDVAFPLISSEIIEICQILSEEFEKISVLGRSRPLRQEKPGRGGGEAGKAITRVSTQHPKLTLTRP